MRCFRCNQETAARHFERLTYPLKDKFDDNGLPIFGVYDTPVCDECHNDKVRRYRNLCSEFNIYRS